MQKCLINNNSDELLLFFTGWGCDEYEFAHLKSNSDVLLLYNYSDLKFDFDFSKYKKINLIAFSAGVFVASVMNFKFKIDRKIALSGNPYLFDEKLGLSKEIQNTLCNITEESADNFTRNYLIKTEEEWKLFHHSNRALESCKTEFNNIKRIYQDNKHNIQDIYDNAFFGSDDLLFNISAQKEFYGERISVIENARHSLFFRIKTYEEILELKI